MCKCLGPAHIGLQLPWPEVHDVAGRHGFQGFELTMVVLDAPAEERGQVAADVDARGVRGGGCSLPMRYDHGGARIGTPNVGLLIDERVPAVAASLESVWP